MILDPWNASGTTTYAASQLGYTSRGLDLNPVMNIVARARLLPPSEADSIEPLVRELVKGVRSDTPVDADDPLICWFKKPAAAVPRGVERRFRDHLIGNRTLTSEGVKLDQMSGLAATFYVALFTVCRQLTEPSLQLVELHLIPASQGGRAAWPHAAVRHSPSTISAVPQ